MQLLQWNKFYLVLQKEWTINITFIRKSCTSPKLLCSKTIIENCYLYLAKSLVKPASRDGYWDLKKSRDQIETGEKVSRLFWESQNSLKVSNRFGQSAKDCYWYYLRLKILIETETFLRLFSFLPFYLTERKKRRKGKRRNWSLTFSYWVSQNIMKSGLRPIWDYSKRFNKAEIEQKFWDWDLFETTIESCAESEFFCSSQNLNSGPSFWPKPKFIKTISGFKP